jgi:hypothetical protein
MFDSMLDRMLGTHLERMLGACCERTLVVDGTWGSH